jgi:SAM-dependent methyltransferase
LAEELVERYDLQGKDIIEIGSGKGEFLRLLCEFGDNRGVGFDPSYLPVPDDNWNSGSVTFIQDYYSEKYANDQADFICSRHTLEHIFKPIDFLRMLRRAIGQRIDTAVFFEVPNARYTLRDMGVWDIIYEHYSYFTAHSLACLFARCDFSVESVAERYAGQFLTVEASPDQSSNEAEWRTWTEMDHISQEVVDFARNYRQKVDDWRVTLDRLKREGRRVVVWGAGSKGATFLNTFQDLDGIQYVVDINPRKQGMYIPGTGQNIVPPEFLSKDQPGSVIVMNPIYKSEIQEQVHKLGVQADLLFA